MSQETKRITGSKMRGILQHPCDGMARYLVKGSVLQVKLPYSTAFEETFKASGGTYEPKMVGVPRVGRIWTPEAIRRITRLNELYAPRLRRHLAAMKAADELLQQNANLCQERSSGADTSSLASPSTAKEDLAMTSTANILTPSEESGPTTP